MAIHVSMNIESTEEDAIEEEAHQGWNDRPWPAQIACKWDRESEHECAQDDEGKGRNHAHNGSHSEPHVYHFSLCLPRQYDFGNRTRLTAGVVAG